ncbi:MAG TPA: 30S ribosomal protein S12 methylthiotransferase RimO [Lentisphaeria bacterium]|nr:MAG: ribosomal protein S12 methylthiotransferase RimO [Lentisphaerae bacterium GWF2_49_21]HBC85476.1 30S ribosomal protein S12 methylthiotransferase RimO [Lentisphaeria bacterium]
MKQIYVYTVSLGCPKNFVDTEILTGHLLSGNIGLAETPGEADVYMINTCAFIPPARTEAESFIRKAVAWKKKKPSTRKIAICGCLVQWDKKMEYAGKYPEVDLWLGIDKVANIAKHVRALYENNTGKPVRSYSENPEFLHDENTPRLQLTPRHYAYIKIADGCDNRCAYCAIPGIRGGLRSRPSESVLNEAESLIANGCKELIIIAQDTTAYGKDLRNSHENLPNLLKELDSLKGDFWIRLLYTHPAHFSDELIAVFKNSKHILPYVDMPLQHISDRILMSMGRKIRSEQINILLSKLRAEIPGIAIRTTFLVGYPGETEEDFKELGNFVRSQKFERLGAFTYYPEAGTPASAFSNKVPEDVAEKRKDIIMRIQAENSLERNTLLGGKILEVLVDKVENGQATGRTFMDAPDIDNTVKVKIGKSEVSPGDVVKVKITSCGIYDVEGEIVS